MSFTSSPLQDTVGESSTKVLVAEVATFISHVLPPILCYFAMAVLAITPRTRIVRIALFPAMVLLALRAAVPVDMSLKFTEREFHHYSAPWVLLITTHALSWALARNSLVRHLRPVNSTQSTLMDALDLVSNFRGFGWDWSHGMHIPRGTRPSNRTGFILHTVLSATVNAFAFGTLHMTIRSFTRFPGGSIFDESLPFNLQFLRSSIIAILVLQWVYAVSQACYDLCTLLGVLALGQHPVQWPPAFADPWRSTSLSDFWGRRWHQWIRYTLLVLGGYPLSFILGQAGIVIGAFFASALFHHILLLTLNSKSKFWRMLVGYGMMAFGIILEQLFKHVTGRKVRGLAGWVWTGGWILLWGNVIADGYTRTGGFGLATPIDFVLPVRMLVEYLVTEFDSWLHAISSAKA